MTPAPEERRSSTSTAWDIEDVATYLKISTRHLGDIRAEGPVLSPPRKAALDKLREEGAPEGTVRQISLDLCPEVTDVDEYATSLAIQYRTTGIAGPGSPSDLA